VLGLDRQTATLYAPDNAHLNLIGVEACSFDTGRDPVYDNSIGWFLCFGHDRRQTEFDLKRSTTRFEFIREFLIRPNALERGLSRPLVAAEGSRRQHRDACFRGDEIRCVIQSETGLFETHANLIRDVVESWLAASIADGSARLPARSHK
jgi:hypothetical protein